MGSRHRVAVHLADVFKRGSQGLGAEHASALPIDLAHRLKPTTALRAPRDNVPSATCIMFLDALPTRAHAPVATT
jgi:hypothetical protein